MPTEIEMKAAEEAKAKADADAIAAAEAKKNAEHMIPKSRLDEEIAKRKELEGRLSAAEQAGREAEEKRLKEMQDYKTLYESTAKELADVKPRAAVAEESERILRGVLEAQVAELPENVRDMVPEALTTQQKLEWLSKHRAQMMKPKAPDIGAGKKGGGAPEGAELTPDELAVAKKFGYTAEEYAKYK